jgi:hypothetical protein
VAVAALCRGEEDTRAEQGELGASFHSSSKQVTRQTGLSDPCGMLASMNEDAFWGRLCSSARLMICKFLSGGPAL